MTRTAVYRHFDASGALLYVGVIAHPWRRIAEHNCRTVWAKDVQRSEVVWFDDKADALAAEERAIASEAPLHNKTPEIGARQEVGPLGEYLKSVGKGQVAFAAEVGLTQATISRICRNKIGVSLEKAAAIERATGGKVTMSQLLPKEATA